MPDHLTRVREQAIEIAEKMYIPLDRVAHINEACSVWAYVQGQVDLASRLTREKIAITLAKKTNPRWDELPGEMHLTLIHSKYGEADAILALIVEGEK